MKTKHVIYLIGIAIISLCMGCDSSEDPKPMLPMLSVDSLVTINEGEQAKISIYLDRASEDTIRVYASTIDETAIAGEDYNEFITPQQIEFIPGDTVEYIFVESILDDVEEEKESFTIILSDAENATISDQSGIIDLQNITKPIAYYMMALIDNVSWRAMTSGFFYAAYNTSVFSIAGYGIDGDSQISFLLGNEVEVGKMIISTDNFAQDEATVTYTPNFYSGGINMHIYGGINSTTGELVIEEVNEEKGYVKGTFEFNAKDDLGQSVNVSNGSFLVPIE